MRSGAAVGGTLAVLLLAGCAARTPTAAPSPAGTGETRSVAQQAEDTFIGTTAAHLCNVQSTVYDDTAALATAYQSPPPYPGLDPTQVAAFRKRLATDAAFSARLTAQLKTACHPTAR
jgi:hypothetical protein